MVRPLGDPYSSLSDDKFREVKLALEEAMFTEMTANPGTQLLFEQSGKVGGQLLVTCTDQPSYNWLLGVTQDLKVGIRVEAVDRNSVPPRTRIGIHIPNTENSVTVNLGRLQLHPD